MFSGNADFNLRSRPGCERAQENAHRMQPYKFSNLELGASSGLRIPGRLDTFGSHLRGIEPFPDNVSHDSVSAMTSSPVRVGPTTQVFHMSDGAQTDHSSVQDATS